MLLGDYQTWLNHSIGMLIVVVVVWMDICKKVAGSNREVASAFKGAATKKAIGFIGRLLK